MMAGGGLEEIRHLRTWVEELREMTSFYRGRYHEAMPIDQIEHYRHLTVTGITGTHTSMGA